MRTSFITGWATALTLFYPSQNLILRAAEPPATFAKIASGNIKIAPNFKIEQIYLVPKEREGSWVAMCVDPKGRFIVSDQNGSLYRVTVPRMGAEGAVQTERLNVNLGGAHGLLYAFDSLYVMVNERTPRGLYRLRDTHGTDHFDEVTLLRGIQGSGEHGPHTILPDPDGKTLSIVCGNATKLTEISSSRVPLDWSEDELLPRLPTGFMDGSLAPQGWIARIDPEGKNWELFAMGMRNEFRAAFNREGELFTYDADMEWDIGDPWYRPTRVNHVTSGAEFGFRNGDAKWPDYYIDSLGAVLNVGPGSPTGMTFGYGAKFPAKYQDALFLADWSFGKIRALHLTPHGSSYTGELEEFISGQPLPVTEVLINPQDGAMYFIVGGRGTQSALYRVTYAGNESTAPSQPDARGREQRAVRHKLEAFHGHRDPQAVATAWPYLGDQDRAIRYAARVAVEWQDPAEWREKALAEKDPRKAIAAVVALARVSGKDDLHRQPNDPAPDHGLQAKMITALGRIDWAGLSDTDRTDLLRAYALTFIRLGHPQQAVHDQLVSKFEPLFPAHSQEVNALLAKLLVYLEARQAAAKITAALHTAPTQEEQIDYARALRALKTGWTIPLREEYFRWFNVAANYRGGNTFQSSLRGMRKNAIDSLTDDEKSALKPILEAKVTRKSPRDLLASRPFVKAWTVNDLVPLVTQGLTQPRDFERGRKMFSEAACSLCHHFDREGGSVGPDLTMAGGRFSVHDLLESIVEPSKVISDQYAAINIRKKNGDVITGRVANLSGNNVSIIEDMFDPGNLTNVRRQDIESMEPSTVSMMPEGLLNTFKPDEIQDLVAYLLSRPSQTAKR